MNGRTNTTSVTEVVEGVQVALEAPTNLVLTPLNARVDLTWTDPVDKYAAPDGQTATNPWDNVATWDHSIVVRKAGSAPTGPDDGELIYTETTRNQHQYTAYSDTANVINNTEYYYAVYAVTTADVVSDPIVDSCKPIEGTPVYLKEQYISGPAESCASIGNHLLISHVVGESYNGISTIDDSFTFQPRIETLSGGGTGRTGTSTSEYAFFGGGYWIYDSGVNNNSGKFYRHNSNVSAYDSSLTQNTCPSLRTAKARAPVTTVNEIVIFGSGQAGDNTVANGSGETASVDAYNNSLTSLSIANMDDGYLEYVGAGTNGTYAMFGGGQRYYNSEFQYTNMVRTYNGSLTKQNLSSGLFANASEPAVCSIDDKILFFGGEASWEGGYSSYTRLVTGIDNSLTRFSVTNVPGNTYGQSAIKFGSVIMVISGGRPYTYDSSLTLAGPIGENTIGQPIASGLLPNHAVFLIQTGDSTCLHIYEKV